jgi:hypothetical protein
VDRIRDSETESGQCESGDDADDAPEPRHGIALGELPAGEFLDPEGRQRVSDENARVSRHA